MSPRSLLLTLRVRIWSELSSPHISLQTPEYHTLSSTQTAVTTLLRYVRYSKRSYAKRGSVCLAGMFRTLYALDAIGCYSATCPIVWWTLADSNCPLHFRYYWYPPTGRHHDKDRITDQKYASNNKYCWHPPSAHLNINPSFQSKDTLPIQPVVELNLE